MEYYLKGASLGKGSALPPKIRLGWKGLPGTNTRLLQKSINYGRNKFCSIGPWGLYHKIYYGRNLRKPVNYGRNKFYDTGTFKTQAYFAFSLSTMKNVL
jgi:hypothetical protein